MKETASLRGLLVSAACLVQLVAGRNDGFRTSLALRDFKEQVSMKRRVSGSS